MKKIMFTQAAYGIGATSLALAYALELSKKGNVLFVEYKNYGFSSDLYLKIQDRIINRLDDIEKFGYKFEDCIFGFSDKFSVSFAENLACIDKIFSMIPDSFDYIVFDTGRLEEKNAELFKDYDICYLVCVQDIDIVRITEAYLSMMRDKFKNTAVVINKTRICSAKNKLILKVCDISKQFDIIDCLVVGFDIGFLFGNDIINNAFSKLRLGVKRMLDCL